MRTKEQIPPQNVDVVFNFVEHFTWKDGNWAGVKFIDLARKGSSVDLSNVDL